jgi:large subunit ribosomal protein L17
MHRHQYKGRKLSRKSASRKALMRGLATSIVLYERIKTTVPKAKELRPVIEKLITVAKKGDLAAIKTLNSYFYDENAVHKLVQEIAPLYKDRNGGYTRIVKVGFRAGDSAPMAIIELLDTDKLVKKAAKPAATKKVTEIKEEKPQEVKEVKAKKETKTTKETK